MPKFELRTSGTTVDGCEFNDEFWGVVNTDTNEAVITGSHDDLGWVGMSYLDDFTRIMNQLWEHPEDF